MALVRRWPLSAKCGSSATRSHRHKAVLSPLDRRGLGARLDKALAFSVMKRRKPFYGIKRCFVGSRFPKPSLLNFVMRVIEKPYQKIAIVVLRFRHQRNKTTGHDLLGQNLLVEVSALCEWVCIEPSQRPPHEFRCGKLSHGR